MKLCKSCVSKFLTHCHRVRDVPITSTDDFGRRCHTAFSEPFFYEASYTHVKKDFALPVDEHGHCVIGSEVKLANKPEEESEGEISTAKSKKRRRVRKERANHMYQCWECSIECKPLTDAERSAIFELRAAFDQPTEELRRVLDTCDNGCPNKHYSKPIDDGCTSVPRLGHPLLCHISEGCTSTIRIFRAASVHYDKLRTLRQPIDTVRRNNEIISTIDRALYSASFKLLLKTLGISDEPVATVVVFNNQ